LNATGRDVNADAKATLEWLKCVDRSIIGSRQILISAVEKRLVFEQFRELPKQHTTSPFSCNISIISATADGMHSAKRDTCSGISSTSLM
jgi:hypothetical protein